MKLHQATRLLPLLSLLSYHKLDILFREEQQHKLNLETEYGESKSKTRGLKCKILYKTLHKSENVGKKQAHFHSSFVVASFL